MGLGTMMPTMSGSAGMRACSSSRRVNFPRQISDATPRRFSLQWSSDSSWTGDSKTKESAIIREPPAIYRTVLGTFVHKRQFVIQMGKSLKVSYRHKSFVDCCYFHSFKQNFLRLIGVSCGTLYTIETPFDDI